MNLFRFKRIFILLLIVSLSLSFLACSPNRHSSKKKEKVEVGSYIRFGAYEQDNDESNGKEPIEWLVLAKEDGKTLIISKYALDWQQ